ncbi:MAG: hypothetical protein GY698_01810 [Actinomycetia bacterium]|nr:hypothetical protein [Actinomycetes bacterium]
MAQVFASEVEIDRPAAEVWAALTDWPNAHTWMGGVDSIEAGGPTETGTTLRFHTRGKDRPAELSAVDPGKVIVVRSTQGGVSADYTYSLRPLTGSRTRVSLVADCSARGFPWAMLTPVLRMVIKRTDGGQLETLRRRIEQG